MEAKHRILFLINPKSGVQNKRKLPQLVEKYLDKNRYAHSVEFTRYAGHASELASAAAKDGFDVVVAVGGDGTINEVGRALAHTSTAMGVIPCGSGNGFARHLGIPISVKGAIDFINVAEPVCIDYGRLNGHPFFCSCGVGFDALVSNDFANSGSRGMFTYIQKTLIDWVTYKPEIYEVETESGCAMHKAFVIACGNASQYGNNAYITPFASMRDGMLSVSVLSPFTAIEVPQIVTQLFNNTLASNSRMKTFGARWIKIRRKVAGPVHYDGEPCVMDAELMIDIVPEGISVLAAPGWDGTCAPVPIYKQFYDIVAGVMD